MVLDRSESYFAEAILILASLDLAGESILQF